MSKKKTSKKSEFSFIDMPILTIKKGVKAKSISKTKKMRNKKIISTALWECLVANDTDGFKEILRVHLELTNKEKLTEEAGLSKRTLYRMLSEEGNPTLENISKIIHKVCA